MKNRKPLYVIGAIVVVVIAIVFFNMPKNESQKVSEVSKTQSTSISSSSKTNRKNKKTKNVKKNLHVINSANSSHNSKNYSDNNGADPKYGNLGYFDIPKEYWGTWYTFYKGKLETMKVSSHMIDNQTLYREDGNYYAKMTDPDNYNEAESQKVADHTKNWGAAYDYNVSNKPAFKVMGWLQGAGVGSIYQVRQEEGQSVLVNMGGAGAWVGAVFYKTPDLAKKNTDKKYSDLNYQDDTL
ncbi:hypothetical protein [Lactobacillus psittaci]|uniref:Uncharacterized protein n=1 Tax=Lactobacillus psittaci DSM 15354 TaxID=1122152 RepID=A0A0R1S314_9LACO|nr:hypothetical protein [Lactobacillus psittaci]KRL63517.1 hypothetical protein FC23_GL000760 [Lactobacillus psittaci DSM 15354]